MGLFSTIFNLFKSDDEEEAVEVEETTSVVGLRSTTETFQAPEVAAIANDEPESNTLEADVQYVERSSGDWASRSTATYVGWKERDVAQAYLTPVPTINNKGPVRSGLEVFGDSVVKLGSNLGAIIFNERASESRSFLESAEEGSDVYKYLEQKAEAQQKWADKFTEFSQTIEEHDRAVAGKIQDNVEGISTVGEFVFAATQGLASMGLAFGTVYVTKSRVATNLLLTGLETSDEYQNAKDAGQNHKEAMRTTLESGVGTYIIESFGNKLLFGSFGSSRIMNTLIGVTGEVTEEGFQHVWQNLVAKYEYNKARDVFAGLWDTVIASIPAALFGAGISSYTEITNQNSAQQKVGQELSKVGFDEVEANQVFSEMTEFAKNEFQTFRSTIKAETTKQQISDSTYTGDPMVNKVRSKMQGVQSKAEISSGQTPVSIVEAAERANINYRTAKQLELPEYEGIEIDPDTGQEITASTFKSVPAKEVLGIEESQTITTTEKKLLNERIKNYARGYRQGRSGMKAELKSLREPLLDLVKRLPAKEKGSFTRRINNVSTPKAVETVANQITSKLKETSKRSTIEEIKKKTEMAKKRQKTGATLNVEEQKLLNSIIKGFDTSKPTKATIDKLNKLKKFAEKQEIISPALEAKLARLDKKPLADMSKTELDNLLKTITSVIEEGKLKMELKKFNNEETLDREIRRLTNVVKPLKKKRFELGVQDRLTRVKDLWNPLTGAPMLTKVPDVLNRLDGHMNSQGPHAQHGKELYWAVTDFEYQTQLEREEILQVAKDVKFKKWKQSKVIDTAIWVHKMQKTNESQVKTLMAKYHPDGNLPALKEDQKQLIEKIKEVYQRRTDQYAAVYESIENKPFPRLDDYIMPNKYADQKESLTSLELAQQAYLEAKKINPHSANARLPDVTKMPRTDILAIAFEGISDRNAYIFIEPKLRQFNKIVNSQAYQEKVDDVTKEWLDNYISTLARRGAPILYNDYLEYTRRHISIGLMSFKGSTIIVQPTAIMDACAYLLSTKGAKPATRALYEFSKSWLNIPFVGKYTKKVADKSEAIAMRKGGDFFLEELYNERYLGDPTGKQIGKLSRMYRALGSIGMKPIQWADIKTAAPVVKAVKDSLIAEGMDERLAQREADFVMEIVSGSSNFAIRPVAFSSSSLGRLLLQIKTFQLSRWDIISKSLVKQGIIKGNMSQKARSFVSLGIMSLNIACEHVIRNWYFYLQAIVLCSSGSDEKEKMTWDRFMMIFLFGPIGELPYIGEFFMSYLLGYKADVSFPVLDLVNKAGNGFISMISGKTEETRQKGFRNMVSALAVLKGVPASGSFAGMVEDYIDGKEEAGDAIMNMIQNRPDGQLPSSTLLKNLPSRSVKLPSSRF